MSTREIFEKSKVLKYKSKGYVGFPLNKVTENYHSPQF